MAVLSISLKRCIFKSDKMSEVAPPGVPKPEMKRLKSAGICKDTVPSVHGRPNPVARARLSNHQRNLSLDFR